MPIFSLGISNYPALAMAGNAYYISTNGSDSNPGTQAAPWRTPAKAFQTVQAGDTVYFYGGNYDVSSTLNLANNGLSGAPITFTTVTGTGAVVIRGNNSSMTTLVNLNDKNCININGIEFTQLQFDAYGRWSKLLSIAGSASYVNITDCKFYNTPSEGININGNHITIDGCVLYDIGKPNYQNRYSININGASYTTVKNTSVRDGYSTLIDMNRASNTVIDNCRVIDPHEGGNDHEDCLHLYGCRNTTIQNCVISNNQTEFHNTIMCGAADTSLWSYDTIIKNNIIWNKSGQAIDFASVTNVSVINCTLAGGQNNNPIVLALHGGNGTDGTLQVKNSVFWAPGINWADSMPGNWGGSNNWFYTNDKPSWPNSWQGDPQLEAPSFDALAASAWYLKSTSPAIGKGIPNTQDNQIPTTDYRGYNRDTSPDLGAEEYGATGTGNPVPSPDGSPANSGSTGNLALNKPVSAKSADSNANAASAAVDGDATTRWSSEASDPQWFYVDLGSSMDLGKVVLKWETAYAKAYKVEVADTLDQTGSTLKTVYSTTDGKGGTESILLPAGTTGRYVFLQLDQRATQWGDSLWEFEVYAPDNTTTTPAPGTGTTPDTSTIPPGDGTPIPPVATPPADTTPPTVDSSTPPAAPDTQAPVTTFDDPLGTAILTGTEKLIKGTTMDDVAVKKVELTIQRGDGNYWTGSDWSATPVWLPADITSGAGTKIAGWTYLWQLVWSDNLPYTIKARGIDAAGNVEGTALVAVRVDNVAPKGTITIDADSKFTNKKPITVTNSIDGASKMRFMVDGSAWTPWEDFAGAKELELTNQPGVKTVTGQFSDGVNTYETSDTIAYLDAPLAEITDIKGIVAYPQGWNMIAAPADGANLGTPLYSYSTTDNAYKQVDSPLAGAAYWAYFDQSVTVPVLLKSIDTYDVLLQPGWNMVGNPFDTAVTLPSGYTAYIYNPSTGDYETSTSIPEGGGAYINSPDARTLTLSR